MRKQAPASADRWVTLLGPLFLLLLGAQARAAEPEWKVGLARVKITPERPVFMAGDASRNKPFEKVAADLYAKALALEDRDGHLAGLVTTHPIRLSAAGAQPGCPRLRA